MTENGEEMGVGGGRGGRRERVSVLFVCFFLIKTNRKAKRKTLGRYCALRCCCLLFVFSPYIFVYRANITNSSRCRRGVASVCVRGGVRGGRVGVGRGGGGNGCRVTRELTDKWEEEQRRAVLIRTRKEQGIKNS